MFINTPTKQELFLASLVKYLLGTLDFLVAISMIRLIHHGAMNGAHECPRLHNSGPIMLTLSNDPFAPKSVCKEKRLWCNFVNYVYF